MSAKNAVITNVTARRAYLKRWEILSQKIMNIFVVTFKGKQITNATSYIIAIKQPLYAHNILCTYMHSPLYKVYGFISLNNQYKKCFESRERFAFSSPPSSFPHIR